MQVYNSFLGGFQKKGLSPEEYQHQRTQLLNRQQLETADLERRLSEEEQDIERGALTDWEVQYARAKLDLKEKHYKVRDNYLLISVVVIVSHCFFLPIVIIYDHKSSCTIYLGIK